MERIRLHPGVWTNVGSIAITGAGAVTGATADQHSLSTIGWVGMVFGLCLLVWGITIDGKHWWALAWQRIRRPLRLPFWSPGNIYIGRILISDSRLDLDHYLDLTIRAHNGTRRTLHYVGVNGFARIQFYLNGSDDVGFDLQPPTFMSGDTPCEAGSEIVIHFRLALTPDQVQEFRRRQALNASPSVMFDALNIMVSRRRGVATRLPLWAGVNFFTNGQTSGQVHRVQLTAQVGLTASLGHPL